MFVSPTIPQTSVSRRQKGAKVPVVRLLLSGPSGLVPVQRFNPFDLGVDVVALVKRKPAAESLRLARRAVGELRIGMEAGTFVVPPRPMVRLPAGDDPPRTAGVMHRGVRRNEPLVAVGLLGKAGRVLQ